MSHALHVSSAIRVALAVLLTMLGSCQAGNYRYVLNDNVLYQPGGPGKATDNVLRDAALQACLDQQLEADGTSDLAQIKQLACAGNGVQTLSGIARLPALEQLELSDNRIDDLRPLAPLKNLRVLGLRNNPVTSIHLLMDMQLLRFVSLQGSDKLPCKEVAALKNKLGNTLGEPTHCNE
jgi:Leucine-rich repeat (LRR) protein